MTTSESVPQQQLSPDLLKAAQADIERDFKTQIDTLRRQYEARMKKAAWGNPAAAARIRAEWDADIDAALNAAKEANRLALARLEKHERTQT